MATIEDVQGQGRAMYKLFIKSPTHHASDIDEDIRADNKREAAKKFLNKISAREAMDWQVEEVEKHLELVDWIDEL